MNFLRLSGPGCDMGDGIVVQFSGGAIGFTLLVNAGIGAVIGRCFSGHASAGFAAGLVLGPIGWAIMAALPDHRRRCHRCSSFAHDAWQECCPNCAEPFRVPPRRTLRMVTSAPSAPPPEPDYYERLAARRNSRAV